MSVRIPDRASEKRLEELRAEAGRTGRVAAPGIRPAGAPFPVASAETGYYGLPLLKEPVWSWEVPVYFFVGGAAGAAAALGFFAQLTGADARLVRDARWIAAAGANLSAPLLIADLGRPERFLAMLRVFKPQSAMSVGAWTVSAFGASATTAAIAGAVVRRRTEGTITSALRTAGDAAAAGSAIAGLAMATYTGVLVGATSIPAWAEHASTLPAHFAASGVASAASLLELRGHREPALNWIAAAAAAFETYTGFEIEKSMSAASRPLRHGATGTLTRIGGVLSGPVPLALRVSAGRSGRVRRLAALSSLAGSLLTRFAWVEAGKASARDPRPALGPD